jgi:pimeloyl-ACP methyl ester carboxylesterase
MQPTIVLIHGAFAESASWDGVIDPLLGAGHPVIAAANPVHGVAADAARRPGRTPDATAHLILEAAALRAAA